MSSFFHGVRTSEQATAIKAPASTTAGLPVVFGTAPLHLASDPAAVNRPVLCSSLSEAVAALGYSSDWEKFTLCEVMYSEFQLFNVSPVVFVNVLDTSKHKKTVPEQVVKIEDKVGKITDPVILSTLVVKTAASSGTTLKAGTDYEAAYDDDGNTVITALENGGMTSLSNVYCDFDAVDPSKVTADDIIGGVDRDGRNTGLEVLEDVFPTLRLVPGVVAAPGWSDNVEVAAVMKAKASSINEVFAAGAVLIDAPTDTLTKYTDVPAWKENNSITGIDEVLYWPMAKVGSKVFHMSTLAIGAIGVTDAANNDVPHKSPSNVAMSITGLCLKDGTEVIMTLPKARYLNENGIGTAINFIGGWKLWGNRTCAYPSNTDVKDAFISSRRMFRWYSQRFIQTFWSNVDDDINKRFIQLITDSANIDLNGLTALGYLLGGRIEFEADFNPTTNLLDGKVKFHTYLGVCVPAEDIENVLEVDPSYLQTLFTA